MVQGSGFGTTIMRALATPGVFALAVLAAAVATSPANAAGLVYVPLGSAGQVVVIDSQRDAVIDTIEGLPAVHGLAGTPDGRFLIAGSYQEREPEQAMPAKPSGMSEDEHAAHHRAPEPEDTAQEAGISTVSVVDVAERAVLRRIDVRGAVHHVAVGPDGRFAAVTHPNGGGISAIDLETFEVAARVETGALPNYAVFSPDGALLFVSNAGDDSVSAVETATWRVAWSLPVGASPEHVVRSDDGETLYVNNVDDGTVSVVSVGQRKVTRTFPVAETLHGIDLSDDGRTLFVAGMGEDKVVAIDLATGTYRSTPLAPAPYHLASVRGSGKIYVSSADAAKIWVLAQDDLEPQGEIEVGGKAHQMVPVPDM